MKKEHFVVDRLVNYAIVMGAGGTGFEIISGRSFKQNMKLCVRELRVGFGRQEVNERVASSVQLAAPEKVAAVRIVDQSFQKICQNMNIGERIRANPLRLKPHGRAIIGAPPHGCGETAARSSLLRKRLTTHLAFEAGGDMPDHVVKQAATDAEALAWSTPYPLLFLPLLMEEKVAGARLWLSHQREILERQKALAEAV